MSSAEAQQDVYDLKQKSEPEQLRYLSQTADESSVILSVNAELMPRDDRMTRLAMTEVMRRKATSLDFIRGQIERLHHPPPNQRQDLLVDAGLLSKLNAVDSALSASVYTDAAQRSENVDSSKALLKKLRMLESDLASSGGLAEDHRTDKDLIDLVQRSMPTNSALIEWSQYNPFNFGARTAKERWAQPHYIAYVLPQKGAPFFVDAGLASDINAQLGNLLASFRDKYSDDVKDLAHSTYLLLFKPIRERLPCLTTIFVAPDGKLDLLPMLP